MSYDVLVIGGGPAGLSASINVRARGRSALVVSNPLEENPLWRAEKVDNYLGLPGLSGAEMLAAMRRHAEQAGVEFLAGKVLNAVQMPDAWYVSVGPDMYNARAVVLAAGVVAAAFAARLAEHQAAGKLAGVKVLEPAIEGATDITESTNVNASIIQANPDLIAAFSLTGNGPVTWSNAARKCGKEPGEITIVAMDYTADNLAEIEAGYCTAIVAQPLYTEAYEAVYYLDTLLRGGEVEYWTELDAPLVYKGGEGENDPATYTGILDRVDTAFN